LEVSIPSGTQPGSTVIRFSVPPAQRVLDLA
jgi:hypothetical protein